ncbi:arginyltransferase [Veronia nyctiphanis]|uniref:Aspartate/glutamate leucyltransferase n=1 Tax=Veronia nyctiphanis TaxID=1278244 RepID=A0A4Q0YR23_9GAMM|nr:arginyltransferase [Veronia nyctiphanis]RXJ73536.1 arginyltransferase [Veronia nyctiphanis]
MIKKSIQLGIMPPSPCSYLPDEVESVAIVLDPEVHSKEAYQSLLESGFRRSGNNIYRPQCVKCKACQSLRIPVNNFIPSTSQKRQINQLKRLRVDFKASLDKNWFALYERYIEARHRSGSMYPADRNDFLSFIGSEWMHTEFMHVYQDETLIAVAVTDISSEGYSALYSFFEPHHKWSLGSICVLAQLQHARDKGIPWLYLGFQIDGCEAMNYKSKYKPNQRFIAGQWV